MTPIITMPKKVSGGEDLFVVQKREFEAFRKWQAETSNALAKIKRGREEYKQKKTVIASSSRKFR